jgi:hypothetical protein
VLLLEEEGRVTQPGCCGWTLRQLAAMLRQLLRLHRCYRQQGRHGQLLPLLLQGACLALLLPLLLLLQVACLALLLPPRLLLGLVALGGSAGLLLHALLPA